MDYTWKTPNDNEAVELASLGFQQPITDTLREDVRNHVQGSDSCLCFYDCGCLVGYMLFTLSVKDVVYIAGTLIRPEYQGQGIKTHATRVAMKHFSNREYFAGRTQSSIVWASVTGLASVVTPNPGNFDVPPQMVKSRDRLARQLGMNGAIHRGFYGGPLYGQKPIHLNPQLQAWWDTLINFERGDALLYIAQL